MRTKSSSSIVAVDHVALGTDSTPRDDASFLIYFTKDLDEED